MRLLVDSRKDTFTLTTTHYSLSYTTREPSYLLLSMNGLSQKLCPWSACDSLNDRDVITRVIKRPRFEKIKGGQRISFEAKSSLYKKKIFVFDCREQSFEYYYRFDCNTPIDKLHFFQGWGMPGVFSPRKKSTQKSKDGTVEIREIKSSKAFFWLFNPEPNGLDRQWVSAQEYAKISVNNDPHFNGANWFFTPGLLAFALAGKEKTGWISMGLAVKKGEYLFNDFEYMSGRFLGFTLTYFGKTVPGGPFETPHIVFHFGGSEREALQNYVEWLIRQRYVTKPKKTDKPKWWREPIFCGWGEQCYQADFNNTLGEKDRPAEWNPHQYANQAYYEFIISKLDEQKIPWRTVIIDDKWQKQRGLPLADQGKWPDMRAFIDKMHKKKKKVLLWWGLFTGEGVPTELCITKGNRKLSEDPTNPAFLKKIREIIRKMLSDKAGCYNADGFKIDFTANLPALYGANRAGKPWGIELLKQYLREIYKTAKKVKKDAFIITHTANPYFMDSCDAIRLNDICEHYQASIVKKMQFRAEMAEIACPGILIDTDNWPCPSRKAWLEYMKIQPGIGIPSLYYATHIDQTLEALRASDWQIVRQIWKKYVKSL